MNKRSLAVVMFVASMSVGALAVGFMGPPTAELDKAQWNLGYNYTYSDMDLDTTTLKWVEVGVDSGVEKLKTENFKTQRHYLTLGYGLAEWWEVYAQIGMADVKAEYEAQTWTDNVNFDNDLAWGFGTRFTIAEQDKVKWGLSAQMNWLDTSWDDNYSATGKETYDIESYDLLVAFGPTCDFGCWKLYGGPFYYYLDGDYDYTDNDAGDLYKETADMEADSNFGGFIGAIFPLSDTIDLTTELAATADGWAFGTGLGWKF
jgi:hypothetical protein